MLKNNWQKAKDVLIKDGVVVLPTDTLYGIVGRAMSKKVVERIYKIKGRNEKKPFIILINNLKDLERFQIKHSYILENVRMFKRGEWPRKTSIILPCKSNKWHYIHRGIESIAFRMIGKKNKNLYNLIKKIGPLVAPSANREGDKPAETTKEAKKYFNDKVDLYISSGKRKLSPSTLIKLENDNFVVLRQGTKKIK